MPVMIVNSHEEGVELSQYYKGGNKRPFAIVVVSRKNLEIISRKLLI